MLVSGVIATAVVLANLAMPHRMRLIGVAVLLVPQLYLPGLPVSLAVLWLVMTCLAGLRERGRSRADSPLVAICGLFTVTTAFSLLWAMPSGLKLGAVSVAFGAVSMLWLREVIVLARDDAGLLDTIMLWTVPGVTLQALLAIAFRFSPALEDRFLRSPLALLTIGRRSLTIFADEPNNVLDPGRSGGFFVNGNVGSLFGGVAALLLCVLARRTMRPWLYAVAGLSFGGSIFTGSKTAFAVGAGCAVAILFLPQMLKGANWILGLLFVPLIPPVISSLAGFAQRFLPNFSSSIESRDELWRRASQMLHESPFFGVGFGGWGDRIGKIGSKVELPPHNFIVAAWVYSGIVAAALTVVFVFAVTAFGLRVLAAQSTVRDRRTAAFAFCATSWVFLHGMADNTAMYGDRQTMVFFALAIGYLYVMAPARDQEPARANYRTQSALTPSG